MLILFWGIALLFLFVCMYFLVRPMLQENFAVSIDEQELITNVYQDRLAQLQHQKNIGEIDQQEFEEAYSELTLSLAEDLPEKKQYLNNTIAAKKYTAALSIIMPVLACGLYAAFGNTKALKPSQNITAQSSPHSMVLQLEQRLQKQSNDVEGWLLLGRSYNALQQLENARNAYERVLALAPQNTEAMLSLAEIIAQIQNNILLGAPANFINQALAIEPSSRRGRWLQGIVLAQQGGIDRAVQIWQKLLEESSANPEEKKLLEAFIAKANANSKPQQTIVESVAVKVRVSLAKSLSALVNPDDTVFIYARMVSGSRMPLAVDRYLVKDLPIEVTLDDSKAMTPQMKLSQHEQVVLEARVSKSGNAKPSAGDLIADSRVIESASQEVVSLIIEKKMP